MPNWTEFLLFMCTIFSSSSRQARLSRKTSDVSEILRATEYLDEVLGDVEGVEDEEEEELLTISGRSDSSGFTDEPVVKLGNHRLKHNLPRYHEQ